MEGLSPVNEENVPELRKERAVPVEIKPRMEAALLVAAGCREKLGKKVKLV